MTKVVYTVTDFPDEPVDPEGNGYSVNLEDSTYQMLVSYFGRKSREVIEGLAEDYFYNHNGVEKSWPLIFTLFDADYKKLGAFEIEREIVPSFVAYPLKEN